jgi:4-amino-4-deoxy-L-arabinose transferase-like glycosyltransferase
VRRFPIVLAAIAAAAFLLRIAYAIWVAPPTSGIFDAFYFREASRLLAEGHGFIRPAEFVFQGGRELASAEHPPLYTLGLALEHLVGVHADTAQRATGAVFGAATVVLLGLVGRRAGGERVGLVSAGLAAVYPILVVADGALLSETLYAPLVASCILAGYALIDRPTPAAALGLGALIGLAGLTRSEALLLVLFLALPAARRGGPGWALRLCLCALAAALVVGPWVVRNWVVFDRPLLSNNEGSLTAQANCHDAYYGREIGLVATHCLDRVPGADEAERASHWRARGIRYARHHTGRLPAVAAVRLLRQWAVYEPGRAARDGEGRDRGVQKAGIAMSWLLIPLAAWGALILQRRREPLTPLLAPLALTLLLGIATWGSVRLRIAADVSLVPLAAVRLASLRPLLRGSRSSR